MGVRISEFNWRGDEEPVVVNLKTDLRADLRHYLVLMNAWLESEDCPGAFCLRSDPVFSIIDPDNATFVVRVRFTLPESAFLFKIKFG